MEEKKQKMNQLRENNQMSRSKQILKRIFDNKYLDLFVWILVVYLAFRSGIIIGSNSVPLEKMTDMCCALIQDNKISCLKI